MADEIQGPVVRIFRNKQICEGEDLVIPYLEKFELNPKNFLLAKVFESNMDNVSHQEQQDTQLFTVLQNCFQHLTKDEQQQVVLKNLPAGEYLLRIKPMLINIRIRVIRNSKRWINKKGIITQSYLFDVNDKCEKIIEQPILESIQQTGATIRMKVKGRPDQLRYLKIHAIAFQFFPNRYYVPGLMNDRILKKFDTYKRIPLKNTKNIFLSNRELGDEFSYVLNRKGQTRYIGNSLEKPMLLMKRNLIQGTTFAEQTLRRDLSYCEAPEYEQEVYQQQQAQIDYYPCEEKERVYKKAPMQLKSKGGMKYKEEASGGRLEASYRYEFQSVYSVASQL